MTQVKPSGFNIGRKGIPPSEPVSPLTCAIYINSNKIIITRKKHKKPLKTVVRLSSK